MDTSTEPAVIPDISKLTGRTRRPIIAAYWVVFFLALPIWWYTTSIERLSLPSARVRLQAKAELRFPVDVEIDTPNASLVANETQIKLSEWSRLAPLRWKGLDINIQTKGTCNTRSDDMGISQCGNS